MNGIHISHPTFAVQIPYALGIVTSGCTKGCGKFAPAQGWCQPGWCQSGWYQSGWSGGAVAEHSAGYHFSPPIFFTTFALHNQVRLQRKQAAISSAVLKAVEGMALFENFARLPRGGGLGDRRSDWRGYDQNSPLGLFHIFAESGLIAMV